MVGVKKRKIAEELAPEQKSNTRLTRRIYCGGHAPRESTLFVVDRLTHYTTCRRLGSLTLVG
jgi:hypothetical protein